MPKRKREDDESSANALLEDQALRIKVSRLKVKIDKGNQNIASALKLARGFERQKLGRRQKTAQNEPKDLLRLKEEIIVLKNLDLAETAKKYMLKQMLKTKRIKEAPAFVILYGELHAVDGSKNGAEANLMGRLFNSNPIKQIMPEIMKGIYDCLGLASGKLSRNAESGAMKGVGDLIRLPPPLENEFEGFSDDPKSTVQPAKSVQSNKTEPSEEGGSDDEGLAAYDDRLGSESEALGNSDNENSSLDWSAKVTNSQYDHRDYSKAPSLSPSRSSTSDPSLSPQPPPPPAATKKTAPTKQPFDQFAIPSLTMGGYYSGSDSDSDIDQMDLSNPLPQQRKNRRGQRARQQIAEKKFGKNARHFAKQKQKPAVSRNVSWDPKRGATDDGRRKFTKARWNSKSPTGANSEAVKPRSSARNAGKSKADRPIHPSWEAARKRKEQAKHVIDAFAGKKITFD